MNKFNFKSLVAVLLTVLMVFSIVPVSVSAAETTATKVTDIANLAVGDQVILVNQDGTHAMGAQNGTKRDIVACEATDGSVTVSGAMAVLTVEAGTQAGTFALKASDGYIGFNNGVTKNQVHTIATLSDDASWTITIADGVATIINVGTSARYLQYNINANQERFACYKNTLQDPVIYKIEAAEAPACEHKNTEVVGAKDATETEEGYTGDTKCTDCGETIATGEKIPVKTPVTPSIPLTNGMQVVIYNPANKKALSSQPASAGSYYQKGVNVTLADGKLTGFADTEIWTVVANEDGTYSFEQGGKKIAMQDSFSSMSLGAANDKWEVIALGDGLFNIKNVKRGNFIEWYASKNNWSTYTSSNAATDPLFQLAFFEVVETEEPACEHKNTEVVGAKDATETEEGYTGDTVCKDCGTVVAAGEKIPVIVNDPAADSTLTIAEALALGASKAHNTYTAGKYYVVGEITEVYNTQYGNMKIKDAEGNILTIYGTYSADGSTRYDSLEVKPVAGDTVKIYGIVGQFNGTAQIKNGWIVEHTPAVCEHANTEIVGAKEATETEEGYTGDKVCTKCGETVEKGTTIPVKTPETVEPAPTGDGMIVVVAAVLLAGAAIALISRKRRFN